MLSMLVTDMLFSRDEVVRILDCRSYYTAPGEIGSVVIDSRKVEKGALFVPLPGTRTDGHNHIEEALARGANTVLVSAVEWEKRQAELQRQITERGAAFLVVADPLAAMQKLASCYIKKIPGLCKIGVTGSNGKTTTKEIIGHILSRTAATYINEGNLNSDIGLPFSIFRIKPSHRFAVLEMGMNYKGEMDILAGIVKPDYAIITNIGRAHIGPLGSMDAIAAEKKKVFKHFNGTQHGYVHEDERYFQFLADSINGEILPYGQKSTRGFEGYRILGLDGTAIYWEGLQISFPLIGYHNLQNALGAITLARQLGIDKQAIKAGLEQVNPLFGRSQIIRGEQTIIQDCYNANPDSAKAVLNFLNTLPWKGRKLVVLGSMLELGGKSREAHRELGSHVGTLKFDGVFFFGEEMEAAYHWLQEYNPAGNYFWTADFDDLLAAVLDYKKAGDLILLKGSRGVLLERLAEKLTGSTV